FPDIQAFRSVIRIIATTRPSLNACSFVSLLQVQTKSFLAVNVLPSCSTRSSPSVIWQTMAFIMGGAMVFDPGCMMTSRTNPRKVNMASSGKWEFASYGGGAIQDMTGVDMIPAYPSAPQFESKLTESLYKT